MTLREQLHKAASSYDGHVTNGSLNAICDVVYTACEQANEIDRAAFYKWLATELERTPLGEPQK